MMPEDMPEPWELFPLPPEQRAKIREHIRDQRERAEQELRNSRLLLAAIVTQHGEALGDGRYRMPVDPAHLETAEARRLSVLLDPDSGAVLLRVGPL